VPTTTDVKRMQSIIAAVRKAGVEVRLVDGWESRGRPGSFKPEKVIEHYDASSTKSGEWGALGVIVKGRPGIPGPLSQFQVSRTAKLAVVAAGRSNHAGEGRLSGWTTNGGNAEAYGFEVANNGTNEIYVPPLHEMLDIVLAITLEKL
jgi:hypothetical protein